MSISSTSKKKWDPGQTLKYTRQRRTFAKFIYLFIYLLNIERLAPECPAIRYYPMLHSRARSRTWQSLKNKQNKQSLERALHACTVKPASQYFQRSLERDSHDYRLQPTTARAAERSLWPPVAEFVGLHLCQVSASIDLPEGGGGGRQKQNVLFCQPESG